MNTTELKAAESALETALDQVRQLIASDAEQKPKPEPVRGPLTVAPEIGTVYWYVNSAGRTFEATWTDHVIDRHRLDRGEVFASEPEPNPETKPKPEPVRGPLTVAPENGSEYWGFESCGRMYKSTWDNDSIDRARLARGNVFASKRDAEYHAAFGAIWGQPIGEWEPEGCAYIAVSWTYNPRCWGRINDNDMNGLRRQWRKGEVGFGDAGRGVLKRRLAEQKKLDERFGL